jgi:hypothetical protein
LYFIKKNKYVKSFLYLKTRTLLQQDMTIAKPTMTPTNATFWLFWNSNWVTCCNGEPFQLDLQRGARLFGLWSAGIFAVTIMVTSPS